MQRHREVKWLAHGDTAGEAGQGSETSPGVYAAVRCRSDGPIIQIRTRGSERCPGHDRPRIPRVSVGSRGARIHVSEGGQPGDRVALVRLGCSLFSCSP